MQILKGEAELAPTTGIAVWTQQLALAGQPAATELRPACAVSCNPANVYLSFQVAPGGKRHGRRLTSLRRTSRARRSGWWPPRAWCPTLTRSPTL